eukprot:TRINITY_DN20864_c0_g3_i1.p1 TRINITY_DN20864_c0_g3~~TRINITY_DN20864_c0_g3_i1.p1  ORF type:complete len:354 (+),score=158.25 TRINITY_DN20864_c0_g3_i1:356-1417(+)
MLVGKYELSSTIGRGRSSKVKIATHTETKEEFVVKIISKKGDDDKRTAKHIREEVRTEIAIMKRLSHANIVRLVEVMESTNHYYIVLESVRGGDLCSKIMEQGKLRECEVAKYLEDLVAGLQACHAAGVAHRDLKPENLLISQEGVLKVADFGLSRLHKPRTQESSDSSSESSPPTSPTGADYSTDIVGTMSYVAPEVFGGFYNAYLADLWSVGVLTFVMLTGKFPFGTKGCSAADLQREIKKGRVNRFPPCVSTDARDLVMKLLKVRPDERLSLDDILGQKFFTRYAEGGEPCLQKETVECETTSVIADDASSMSGQWSTASPSGASEKTLSMEATSSRLALSPVPRLMAAE